MIWAVVPVKELARAKQRLAGRLGPEQRRALSRAMLADVLAALDQVRGLAGLLIVSSDPEVRRQVAPYGARLLDDPDGGLNPALSHAARHLAAEQATGLVIVPADAPLTTSAEIEALLARREDARSVVIASDRQGTGTNGFLCAPPHLMTFQYGPGSFAAHCAAAQALGITPEVLSLPGLGFDIDTPEDLAALIAHERVGAAYGFLIGTTVTPLPDERRDVVRKVV